MFEYIQGEGGVLPLEREFVDAIYSLCEEKDVLTIADEVQTGVGRTGKFLAGENFGKRANITTLAKGIAGGLPMGVCLADEKCCDVLSASTHGSTFGGNPVACAGALSIIQRIDDTLLASVRKKSAYIFDELSNAQGVKSVSGKGFMIGIETEKDASAVIAECIKRGVLVIKAKNKIRLLPALNIPFEQLRKAINIIKEVIAE
jgi:acetylornithine/N-succinyldiaminopimelate aminotransferase